MANSSNSPLGMLGLQERDLSIAVRTCLLEVPAGDVGRVHIGGVRGGKGGHAPNRACKPESIAAPDMGGFLGVV